MPGPMEQHHLGSKPAREIFLTSSSLSFSSLSSSCSSSDDVIELNTEGKHLKGYSRGSEISCVTNVTMQPAPSPRAKLRPGSPYDPERIPSSVFGKNKDLNWSDDSLFSLRMSNYEAVLIPEEFLGYSPSLKLKSEDEEEEKKKKTSTATPPTPTPPTSYSYPCSFAQLYQAPLSSKVQSCSLPVAEKKRKKTRKNKKEEKEEKKKCCCIWSWLFPKFTKCKCYLSCCC